MGQGIRWSARGNPLSWMGQDIRWSARGSPLSWMGQGSPWSWMKQLGNLWSWRTRELGILPSWMQLGILQGWTMRGERAQGWRTMGRDIQQGWMKGQGSRQVSTKGLGILGIQQESTQQACLQLGRRRIRSPWALRQQCWQRPRWKRQCNAS
jgi:hypothetical protein